MSSNLGSVENHDIHFSTIALLKTSFFSFLAKAAKGGVNIKNIKAFRQDLPDKQGIKNQPFKRSCQSCYPV
jgi:hypothetical protein